MLADGRDSNIKLVALRHANLKSSIKIEGKSLTYPISYLSTQTLAPHTPNYAHLRKLWLLEATHSFYEVSYLEFTPF